MKREDIISSHMPAQGGPMSRLLGGAVLKLLGWKIVGQFPAQEKLLIIVAPHTSNWDFIIAMAAKFYMGVRVRYLMKSEINIWPFRSILKWSGGVPVYRYEKTDILEQTADWLMGEDNVWLGLSPEGTRRKIEKWKTGFLRIAEQANVPIFVVGLDGANKQIVLDKLVSQNGPYEIQAKWLQDYTNEKFTGIKPQNQ